jgi:hypothetical protein
VKIKHSVNNNTPVLLHCGNKVRAVAVKWDKRRYRRLWRDFAHSETKLVSKEGSQIDLARAILETPQIELRSTKRRGRKEFRQIASALIFPLPFICRDDHDNGAAIPGQGLRPL